ncbi:pectinesterase family protein [Oxalobacteraceae bacterium A2-2]
MTAVVYPRRHAGLPTGEAGGTGRALPRPPRGAAMLALATLATLAAWAPAAQAQDTRQVVEPSMPAACTVLSATADTADGDDTARIQAALDQCGSGKAVRLAASGGKRAFVAGPLTLRNGASLQVDSGVTLYASSNPALFDRGSKTCGSIDQNGKGCKPFITIDKSSNSGIYGDGVIDGQGGRVVDGGAESWWQLARRAQKEDARQNVPRLIEIGNSNNITLYRITLRNSPNFHVAMNKVDGFTAWGVRIDTPATARNTDGIDPGASRNVTIAHSYIRTGDDNVAIKAGGNGPTENVSILHNRFYSGHGMSIGSETNSGVRRVLVQDLTMDGTTSGLRIKSDVSRGGPVQDITYRDVCMRDIKAPIDLSTTYNAKAEGRLVPVFTNLVFENVHSVTPGRLIAQGYDEQRPIEGTLRNVSIAGKADRRVSNARFTGEPVGSSDNGACAGKFQPFPEAAATGKRPQLSLEQAKMFSYTEVLKYVGEAGKERIDPWDPLADPLAQGASFTPDYVVDAKGKADGVKTFNTVQAAVSRILTDGANKRVYLLVKPGVYPELVYIPAAAPPITLYGVGKDAAATVITARLDAAVPSADYVKQYGPQFAAAHPAVQAMYAWVRDRQASIGTMGSMTVWVQNQGFQARNLTIANAYNKDTGNGAAACEGDCKGAQNGVVHHQAVALQVDGADKAQFENVRLIGFQDTLFLKSPRTATTTRSFFNKSYIEGDVDFIFGDSTAYFHQSEVKTLGDRSTAYVAAPDTNWKTRYGFVFDHVNFTHDGSPNALKGKFNLLRQWFHSSRCTPYGQVPVEGYRCALGDTNVFNSPKGVITRSVLETVGKMVVLNSRIGAHIDKDQPWSDWNRAGTLAYRPVQYSSDDYWDNLLKAGIDPVRDLGYSARPAPAEIYLGEYNNSYH